VTASELFAPSAETKQKKTPFPAQTCASSLRPACAETHPLCGGLKQSARFFLSAPPMLGAGQREEKPHNVKNSFQAPFEGAASGLTLGGG